MFQPGELVAYGATGVCRVESIDRPDRRNAQRAYYHLKPLYQDGEIYAPVDNPNIHIRQIISREEAEALIDQIPTIRVEAYHASSLQALEEHYRTAVRSCGGCRGLLELAMSIYAKQQQARARKRQLPSVDARYWKRVEQMLHGELSAALNIPIDAVGQYISDRLGANPFKLDAN